MNPIAEENLRAINEAIITGHSRRTLLVHMARAGAAVGLGMTSLLKIVPASADCPSYPCSCPASCCSSCAACATNIVPCCATCGNCSSSSCSACAGSPDCSCQNGLCKGATGGNNCCAFSGGWWSCYPDGLEFLCSDCSCRCSKPDGVHICPCLCMDGPYAC